MRKMIKVAMLATTALGFTATNVLALEWNVSLWGKRRAFTEHVEKLAELVSEKTGGDFTLNISYGGLSKNRENLDGISIGAFEMAQFCSAYHPDKNPTLMVLDLPFLGVETLKQEGDLDLALYQHPAAVEDLKRWNAKVIMASPLPQYNLAGVGEAPSSLADMEGLRVRATGGIGEAFKKVGAVPTSVTSSEAYTALESGVVDAVAFAPHAHLSFRTIEIADWWTTNLNPGSVNCPVVVNIDAYNALSDEHREALDSSIPAAMERYYEAYQEVYDKWGPVLEENGVEKVTLPEETVQGLQEAAATPVREEWIAANKDSIPAEELYQFVKDKLAELKSQ